MCGRAGEVVRLVRMAWVVGRRSEHMVRRWRVRHVRRPARMRWRARTHSRCTGLAHVCRRRSGDHMAWARRSHVSWNRSASADVVMLGVSLHSIPGRSCVLAWRWTGRRLARAMLRIHAVLSTMLPWPSNTVLPRASVLHPPDTVLRTSDAGLTVLRSVLRATNAVRRAAHAMWARS